MNKRTNGHRYYYKEILKRAAAGTLQELDTNSDLYMLGMHLHFDHGLMDPNAFDRNIEFGILDVVSPADIEMKE